MRRRAFVGSAATLATGIASAGCGRRPTRTGRNRRNSGEDEGKPTTQVKTTTASPTPTSTATELPNPYPDAWFYDPRTEIVILSVEGTAEQFSITIRGEARNASDTAYDYVSLQFGLFDETEAKLGSAVDNVTNLDAGQRWRFEAIGTAEDAETFTIEEITVY